MEFTLPIPLGSQASLLAQTPMRKPPDNSRIERAPDAGKARTDMHNSKGKEHENQQVELIAPKQENENLGPETLVGPPPSFQVNVLEMDQKLQQKLAKIEADRAQAEKTDNSGPNTATSKEAESQKIGDDESKRPVSTR